MYGKQENAFFNDARYSCIEASTKSGKTHGALVWLTEKAIKDGEEGKEYSWHAPIYRQSNIAYRRLKRALGSSGIVLKYHDTDMYLDLDNGSRIKMYSGENPDNIYGDDAWAAVIDEGSRYREESYYAVRSTLTSTRGQLRVVGNVKGKKNWFYRMCRRGEGGEPDYEYHKITCWDAVEAGVLDVAEINDAKANLPEAVFKELYEAEATDDEGNPFGYSSIQKCIKPLSSKEPVCFGIDLGKAIDYTVVIGLDEDGDVCFIDRFQLDWEITEKRIENIVRKKPVVIDATGLGATVYDNLKKRKLNIEPFVFSSPSKQELIGALIVAVQQQAIGFPEGVIVDEMNNFEYQYTRNNILYAAIEGYHDDAVCALALAFKKFKRPKNVWKMYNLDDIPETGQFELTPDLEPVLQNSLKTETDIDQELEDFKAKQEKGCIGMK